MYTGAPAHVMGVNYGTRTPHTLSYLICYVTSRQPMPRRYYLSLLSPPRGSRDSDVAPLSLTFFLFPFVDNLQYRKLLLIVKQLL